MHTLIRRRIVLAVALVSALGLGGSLVTHTVRAQSALATIRNPMGTVTTVRQPAWLGYYDGHKDTYLNTDVSSKAQATAMHVNYAPGLASVPISHTPAIYLVSGRAVASQIAVFGSEPGESDYSPVWHEVSVTWKAGVTPVLLTSDNQLLSLATKGKLTVRQTHVLLNCPIIKVGM
jgi:hypothetical protein